MYRAILMVTIFVFVFWVVMRVADFVRPSAVHRTHSLFWLFAIFWVLLVAATVGEDRAHIASGYVIVYLATSVFGSLIISLLELFALKTTAAYVEELDSRMDALANSDEGDALISPTPGEGVSNNESAIVDEPNGAGESSGGGLDDEVPTETSPLIGGNIRNNRPTTFATGYRRSLSALLAERRRAEAAAEVQNSGLWAKEFQPFGVEQDWSKYLPTWTWFLQFLILGPFNLIILGQLLLILGAAVQQTGTDGSDLLMPYLLVAAFSVLALLPLTPFLHRVSKHIPLFFAVVFVGTLIYSLATFPFSAENPFKFTLKQSFSIDHKNSSVMLTGYEGYIGEIINNLPSAAGRPLTCTGSGGRQSGLLDCTFDGTGLEPRVDGDTTSPFSGNYDGLISVNTTRVSGKLAASFDVNAVNTKVCGLRFDRPVKSVSVRGSGDKGPDTRFGFDKEPAPSDGNWEIGEFTLWRRDWETPWTVDVEWANDDDADAESSSASALTGQVLCRWGDANTPGTAPAADEAWKYAPTWSIVTIRQNPPLIQGSKSFSV